MSIPCHSLVAAPFIPDNLLLASHFSLFAATARLAVGYLSVAQRGRRGLPLALPGSPFPAHQAHHANDRPPLLAYIPEL